MNAKIIDAFMHPGKIVAYLGTRNHLQWMNDKRYLEILYKAYIGDNLNLIDPRGFNEKLQWLKLYDRNPMYTELVDKYKVKEYIAEKIGVQYVIPPLGVWNKAEEIDFNVLPNKFVLKCTHDSGRVIICRNKNKLDITKARKELNDCLKRDFFYTGREWPYKNVSKKIIAEEFMDDGEHEDLLDYKLMCFNGKVRCTFVCSDRRSQDGLKVTFFDNDWNKLPFQRHYPSSSDKIVKPQSHEKMIKLAEILSQDIPFVRVDFYEIKGKIYFGELTFYPGSGFEEFEPKEWDRKLGDWLALPEKN